MRRGMRTGIATAPSCSASFSRALCGRRGRHLDPSHRRTLEPRHPRTSNPPSHHRTIGSAHLINQYCVACHNDKLKSGGLTLSALNLDAVHQSAEVAEKVIRKLRGGLMPPAGAKRPDARAAAEFVSWLENKIDTAATVSKPGRVALRRLNRREYGYAIRDLLGLNIDATAWLPDDNVKGNFDNNAAALQVSPNFIDQYIYAARAVALEAIGNPKALAETTTYGDVANMVISLPPSGAPGTGRQQHRLEGMPFGTRGGFSRRAQLPGRRRVRAHHRRHGARARSAADGVREHGDRRCSTARSSIARRSAATPTTRRSIRRWILRSKRSTDGCGRSASRRRKGSTSWRSRSCIAASPRATSATRTIALEGGQERIQAAHALQIRGPLSVTGMSASASRSKIFICSPDRRSATKPRARTRSSRTSRAAPSVVR